ncbi:MAG: discoidin domain-containing protein, partial [bacterium]
PSVQDIMAQSALAGWFARPRQPEGWKALRASSFQPGEGEPDHAVDGDPQTFWHTRWSPDAPAHPHELVIDMGKTATLRGVRYRGREWNANGRVAEYRIHVSATPDTPGEAVATGRLGNHSEPQDIRFDRPATGRYLTFVALSEVDGKPYTSIAELEPLGDS